MSYSPYPGQQPGGDPNSYGSYQYQMPPQPAANPGRRPLSKLQKALIGCGGCLGVIFVVGGLSAALTGGHSSASTSSHSTAGTSTSTAVASTSLANTPHAYPSARTTPTVGSTIDLTSATNNAKFSVTLLSVSIDTNPNDVGPNSLVPANTQLYSAKLQITDIRGTYNDDTNNDATLIGSDKQSYSAGVDSITGCTNFNNGTVTLSPGQSAVGCVSFEVPDGVTATQFQYDPSSGFGGTTIGEWNLP